jgi:L-lysine exporter family protein LysE/ArgO
MSSTLASPAVLSAAATGFGLSASLIVAIGAQNAYVLRQGIRREHVGPVVTVCALLDLLLMAAGVAGLGAVFIGRPGWLDALALAGAVLLAIYGLGAARRAWRPSAQAALQAQAQGQPVARREVVLQVLAISLLNPHVYLDTVVLVGAVGARQAAGTQGAFVAGAGLASALWFVLLGYGARVLSPWFARPAAWRVLDAVVALTMLALAFKLAWPLWAGR